MINQQLKYSKKEVRNKGLGFVAIPPPYNHNYSSIPMTDEEIADLPEMEYGKPEDRKVESVKPKKVKITRPDKTEIILEKQAFDKTFVKPAEVSNHTETLNFEKNADVDKHFQVLDNTESTISQKPSELQNKREESQIKSTNLEFAMLNEFFEWCRKQTDSAAPSDSSCDSSETANCEKSELVDSAESSNESPEIVESEPTIVESEPPAPPDSKCESPEATDSEKLKSVESSESSCESSEAANSAVEDSAEPLQKEYEVIVEDWVEEDDVVCQKVDDVFSKKSNLSADASPYVRKAVSEPALRGPSNKYVPPKPTVRNENVKSNECANCCKQGHKKQRRKFEQFANKSSNKSYNSYSASVGWNGSGYAPYVKKQTCYNCGIPGHIARNCTHRPYVPYYT
ncbi:uncharacterized protein LOC110881654 [Helianthus annuus]|uniref:uncharacterized protein LOC110881654 n=1 Tax=Helianthus annuus TaxID=4232 RepID=UPI000B8F987A|nr:uncharacterized protein LOC110881654 [Helianthus annuus]